MIELRNVSKSFKTPRGIRNVLSDFSFSIKDGTFLGVTGESGSGKSTLVSMIAGLQKIDSGSILIDGREIFSFSDDEICQFRNENIGFVSQEQSFLENLTVLDNVILPALLSKKLTLSRRNHLTRKKTSFRFRPF